MSKKPKAEILVIDDEASICFAFERFFGSRDYHVVTAGTGSHGLNECVTQMPNVIFVDVRLPDTDGIALLEKLHELCPQACIIVITAYGSLTAVSRAIKNNAFDCLVKPLDLDRALEIVEQYLQAVRSKPAAEPESTPITGNGPVLIGNSASMQDVFKSVARAATTDTSVLITGETGTGKDLIARSIHALSKRSDTNFTAVNCGAIPDTLVESELFGHKKGAFTGADKDKRGRFEVADSGTLFLDEIGELPPSSQVKLLRFLDSHTIERLGDTTPHQLDIRILAATNQSLEAAMHNGGFRQDLYYRLAVIEIEIPPLRRRSEDILPLAQHFINEYYRRTDTDSAASHAQISPDAAKALTTYNWPGNVRELRNTVEHSLTMSASTPILPLHLPPHIRNYKNKQNHPNTPDDFAKIIDQLVDSSDNQTGDLYTQIITPFEKALIRRVVKDCQGNQSEAATRLGFHRNTLRRKLREL
ncbi:MAG: sigma-54 dependent transcriptional regulator [Lentisphaeria bacterium]